MVWKIKGLSGLSLLPPTNLIVAGCHRSCKVCFFFIISAFNVSLLKVVFLILCAFLYSEVREKRGGGMSMKSKGGATELSARNVQRKWALLLCVASFCAGMFFTNRYFCFWVSIFQHRVCHFSYFLRVIEFLGCKLGLCSKKGHFIICVFCITTFIPFFFFIVCFILRL